jgi:hypothetical protein
MISPFEFLKSIPDVIWSGLIASALTLSGVIISNRSNTNRLMIQLKHDANEKAKDRTAILRREVYLNAVEEMVKANAHLSCLPQLDLTKINIADGLQGFFSTTARLQLIAEPKTALLVSTLTADYSELLFNLMILLMPASQAKSDIHIAENLYSSEQSEVTRILAEMSKLNESGHPDPHAFHALETSAKFHQSQAANYANQRSDAWNRFNHNNFIFQKSLLTELRNIGSKQIPVMIEIRRDLGLTGDLAEIENQMKEQWDRMEKRFDSLIASLIES